MLAGNIECIDLIDYIDFFEVFELIDTEKLFSFEGLFTVPN